MGENVLFGNSAIFGPMGCSMRNLVLAAGLILAVSPASAAVIRNGSFETQTSTQVNGSALLSSGSKAIKFWTVGTGNVDLISSYWNASAGSNSVDLNGTTAGSLSTNIFGLTIGRIYNAMFDMAANPFGGTRTKQIQASVTSAGALRPPKTFSAVQAQNTSALNWSTMVFRFTASAPTQLLTFRSTSTSAFGAAIDNVRIAVQPVPLPATAPLALLGLAGLAFFRRRKTA